MWSTWNTQRSKYVFKLTKTIPTVQFFFVNYSETWNIVVLLSFPSSKSKMVS